MTQGVLIGWFGALLGLRARPALAFNVGTIVPLLERLFGVQVFDPTVFVHQRSAFAKCSGRRSSASPSTALVLTVLATIYPALRGAATEPAEALRYE